MSNHYVYVLSSDGLALELHRISTRTGERRELLEQARRHYGPLRPIIDEIPEDHVAEDIRSSPYCLGCMEARKRWEEEQRVWESRRKDLGISS